MATIGRPPVGQRVCVRLPDEMLHELDARATAAGLTRAEAIRRLLERTLSTGPHDGVDRTQIARRLRMTPSERFRTGVAEARRLRALRGHHP